MEVRFTRKEQSKFEQEQAFLRLSSEERLREFFRLSNLILKLPAITSKSTKNNFVIAFYKEEND